MKKSHDSDFFTRLFVSERKQIALMADEKSPSRVSHRLFATSRSEKRRKRGHKRILTGFRDSFVPFVRYFRIFLGLFLNVFFRYMC